MTFHSSKRLYRDEKHQYEGKTGRVIVSWNRFARSVKEAFEVYTESKQAEFYLWLEELPARLRVIPFKEMLTAALPFLMFLFVFSNYSFLRNITGLSSVSTPNGAFLPWLEMLVFHCYPHRILARFAHPVLDFFAAVPYLFHFGLPFLFIAYKFASSRSVSGVYPFLWCAGWVNLVAIIIQLIFPTTPPWFVDSAVFGPNGEFLKSQANEAGFHRLDAVLGFPFFHNIYATSPVKFGAFPSLHVAWPAVILVSGPWISEKFAMFHVAWITWAALYSNHHYGVDAIAGILLVFLVNFMMIKVWSPFQKDTDANSQKSRGIFKSNSAPLLQV